MKEEDIKIHVNKNENIDSNVINIFKNAINQVLTKDILDTVQLRDKAEKVQKEIKKSDIKLQESMDIYKDTELVSSLKNLTNCKTFINRLLRKPDLPSFLLRHKKEAEQDILNIDKAINLSSSLLKQINGNKNIPILVGRIVQDCDIIDNDKLFSNFPNLYEPGYLSTSIELNFLLSSQYLDEISRKTLNVVVYIIHANNGIRIFPDASYEYDYEFEILLARSSVFKTLAYTDLHSRQMVSNRTKSLHKHFEYKNYDEDKNLNIRFILLQQCDQISKIDKDLYNMATGEPYDKNTKIIPL